MKRSLIALATAGLIASGAVAAQSTVVQFDNGHVRAYQVQNERWNDGRDLSVDEREARLHNRIQRGLESGRLTNREGRRLMRELDNVEAKERAFQADGRLGRREREDLHNDLDRLANELRNQLRDDDQQRRY
jgi:hypothetical protein